ncbi:trypco2 family protein [Pontivivens nitratireducens]|uniref:trypco2 family protein n=1 Tax=Pontivivens nitratireducens TaxID=2758038 RepID=UPI0016395AB2|nr:trypco2 family protein [Pontibrevibacter nitratireducens]
MRKIIVLLSILLPQVTFAQSSDRIALREYLENLRSELQSISQAGETEYPIFLSPVDVELTVGFEAGASGGASFWVFQASADISSMNTQSLSFTVYPNNNNELLQYGSLMGSENIGLPTFAALEPTLSFDTEMMAVGVPQNGVAWQLPSGTSTIEVPDGSFVFVPQDSIGGSKLNIEDMTIEDLIEGLGNGTMGVEMNE